MEKIIVGIEKNIPYNFQGMTGVTNRFYLLDKDPSNYTRENGCSFSGQKVEFIKVPKNIDINQYRIGSIIRPLYNRYGQVEEIQIVGSVNGSK